MLRNILTISGRPGLFKLIGQGKNQLIVEDIAAGKRMPAYARDKVSSLGDISIYTLEGDTPLAEVLEKVRIKENGALVDVKALDSNDALRAYFKEVLPEFDADRVHPSDIRKLLTWYNLLINNGFTAFVEAEEKAEEKAEEPEK